MQDTPPEAGLYPSGRGVIRPPVCAQGRHLAAHRPPLQPPGQPPHTRLWAQGGGFSPKSQPRGLTAEPCDQSHALKGRGLPT